MGISILTVNLYPFPIELVRRYKLFLKLYSAGTGQDRMGKTMIDLVIGLFVNSGFFFLLTKFFLLLHLHGINAF